MTSTTSTQTRTTRTRIAAHVGAPAPTRARHAADPGHARRWWVLGVLGLAQLMVILDTTVVNIALPSAQRDLGFTNDDRQWVVTAYALAFGSLLLLGGRLSDIVGRKRMFLVGLAGFATASAVGGLATDFDMLVGARAVQGAFGAVLAPAGLSLLTTTFADGEERSKAFGIYGAIAGGGSAVGLLLGGLLTEYLSWRWCMYVNVAFAAVAFVGALVWLTRRSGSARTQLDIPGILLVSSGLFCVVYGFSCAETKGWSDLTTIVFFVAAAVLLLGFVLAQTQVAHPVLPLRVVLDRYRGGSLLAILMASSSMFGINLFLTYFLQQNLGFSAVRSGLAFLPMTAALMTAAQVGSIVLGPRIGPKYVVTTGLLGGATGMAMLTGLGAGSDYVVGVLPAMVVFGLGVGLVFSSSMSLATAGVRSEDAGAASAMVSTVQQVGGSIGTALLSTIAASAATAYATAHAQSHDLAAQAAVHSYTSVFAWSAGILALAAVITAVALPGTVRPRSADETEVATVGG